MGFFGYTPQLRTAYKTILHSSERPSGCPSPVHRLNLPRSSPCQSLAESLKQDSEVLNPTWRIIGLSKYSYKYLNCFLTKSHDPLSSPTKPQLEPQIRKSLPKASVLVSSLVHGCVEVFVSCAPGETQAPASEERYEELKRILSVHVWDKGVRSTWRFMGSYKML